MVELLLSDLAHAYAQWQEGVLLYFDTVSAHASCLIGKDTAGIPNNLMFFIAQVAVGHRDKLSVFGDDYPTPDGAGVRDYIYVVDLALGHVAALNRLISKEGGLLQPGYGAMATACPTPCAPSKRPVAARSPTRSCRAALVILSVAMRRPIRRVNCRAGKNREISTICALWRWQHQDPQGYAV